MNAKNIYSALLTISLILFGFSSNAQVLFNEYGGSFNQIINDFEPAPNGGYIFIGTSGQNSSSDARLWMGLTDQFGQLVWDSIYTDFDATVVTAAGKILVSKDDGNYYAFAKRLNETESLLEIDLMGNILFETNFSSQGQSTDNSYTLVQSPDKADVLIMTQREAHQTVSDNYVTLHYVSDNPGWTHTIVENGIDFSATDLITSQYGDYMAIVRYLDNNIAYCRTIRLASNGIKSSQFDFEEPAGTTVYAVAEAPNGDLIYAATTGQTNDYSLSLLRYDTAGNKIWENSYLNSTSLLDLSLAYDIAVAPNGNIAVTGHQGVGGSTYDMFIVEAQADGTENFARIYDFHNDLDVGLKIRTDSVGGYLLCGTTAIAPGNLQGLLMRVDSLGNFYNHLISGYISRDANTDCQHDNNDFGFADWYVKIAGERIAYTLTDTNGYYEAYVDTGDYVVTTFPRGYWLPCQDTITVDADMLYDTSQVDFPVTGSAQCSYLEVDISSIRMRLCAENTYKVNYCSYGTLPADDVTIEVTLDSLVTYVSATAPLLSQSGNTYTFDIGDLSEIECGEFEIKVMASCDVNLLGNTICTQAHIFPDTSCFPANSAWSGPLLRLTGSCEGDSVIFKIENIGGDMSNPHEYIVIEDNIMLMIDDFDLNQGESIEFSVDAMDGSVYHLLAAQDSNLPASLGNIITSYTQAACQGNANMGFSLDFPQGIDVHYLSHDCQELIGAYDPNDKAATPRGWQAENLIDRSTKLDYKIRFQNTGTDTAFRVQIVDTISRHLDPGTIEVTGASHPYEWDIFEDGILVFTFKDIMLPDSNVNKEGSNGYVQFSIDQQPKLPYGTVINNEAAIYFDLNPPIFTNETFHTIAEPMVRIVSSTIEVSDPEYQINCFPNPAYEQARVVLEGTAGGQGMYELYNIQGQRVQMNSFQGNAFDLSVEDLQSGLYIVRIVQEDQPVGTLKLMVSR